MHRRSWEELPTELRQAIEAECGTVLRAEAPSAGRNSTFAAFLHTVDGTVFVKGVPDYDRLVTVHEHEIQINSRLRDAVRDAPRLLWTVQTEGWLLAGYEIVPGEHADLTPGSPDVPAVVEALSRLAQQLTPSPAPGVSPLSKRYARLAGWQWLADHHVDQLDAWEKQHLDLLLHFDDEVPSILPGYSLVHGDIHQLNLLVHGDQVRLIDWAWSRTGPPWVDAALLVPRLIAEGREPAEAERLVSDTWGMQHTKSAVESLIVV
ncbi:Ser/Thr protein kinase RdoA involved in Cpx stress response, MazF antagonist [Promicromonospora umidemergens]|uniref:Aminoglycoside phosphotransferase domain-containing protein n=1 Tax=Promicromonospora umidemergens TaxID=629679 RepID=A0ABP8Y3V1_9MICO|nr:aminoglycoside phosphotransferase family protein [Promicromonospora umidemergens]MCP2287094.1 Ser/Thr protein kinase RdoA involved in Cpx stress response, MazF antagonist [Promicromonospora umidemergens]